MMFPWQKSQDRARRRKILLWASLVLVLGLALSIGGVAAQEPTPTPTPGKEAPMSPPPERGPLPESTAESPEEAARGPEGMVNVIIYLKAQPLHRVADQVKAEFQPSLEGLRRRIQAIYAEVAPEVPEGGWATREEEVAAYQTAVGLPQQREQEDGERTWWPGGGALAPEQRAQANDLSAQLEATLQEMRREMLRRAQPETESYQANLAQWLESVGGTVFARLSVVNALTAALPEDQLEALRARPDVAQVVEDRAMTAHLDHSHYAIRQDVWDYFGYSGGEWDPGILDSGVDSGHPYLDHLTWLNRVCLAAPSPYPSWDSTSDDVNGHGTHVAGIVVNNDWTYWGMAWDTDLALNLKAAYDLDGSDGGNASMYWTDMMDCTDWALTSASDHADVFNLSYGGCWTGMPDDTDAARFWDAVVYYMWTPAAISAGNYDSAYPCTRYIGSPATAYNVIAVANVDDKDTASAGNPYRVDDSINSNSSWGPTPAGRKKPDLAAPGTDIWSADNSWEGPHADWVEYTGTSMAAPHVTGAILLLEEYGIHDPLVQKAILINTAEDKGTTGWDKYYGWGYIDLENAWIHKDDWFTGSIYPSPDYDLYKGPVHDGDTAALVWYRRVVYPGDTYPSTYYDLSDLNLYLYDEATNIQVDYDVSVIDNVHMVRSYGSFSGVIKVDAADASFHGASYESYALATQEGFSPAAGPALALGTSNYNQCLGDHWTVDVRVEDIGDLPAHDVRVRLNIPAGLSLVSGQNPQNVGKIDPGGIATASWILSADSAGDHSVRANAISLSYGESYRGSSSFTVSVSTPAAAPTLYSPLDGSSSTDTTPYFDWSSVSGATSYHIQVDENPSFSSPEIDATTPTSNHTPDSPLLPDTYYWRVNASNACGDSPWSSTWSLTILTPQAYVPLVLKGYPP